MNPEEQHQEWRSQLAKQQNEWMERAGLEYSKAMNAYRQYPSELNRAIVQHAREHLEAQKDLVRRSSEALEVQIQMREESPGTRGDRP